MKIVKCVNCGKEILEYLSKKRVYCSVKCKNHKDLDFNCGGSYYLVGVYMGDGTLGIYKNKCYKQNEGSRKLYVYYVPTFSFGTIDYDFALKVKQSLMDTLGLKKLSILKRKPSKTQYGKKILYVIMVRNKEVKKFMDFIKGINLYKLKKYQAIEILRGFFDSEGCVIISKIEHKKNKTGVITTMISAGMSTTNEDYARLFVNILNSLKIENRLEYVKNKDYYVIHIYKNALKRLYSLFGNKLTIKRKDEKMVWLNKNR